jgi:cytochrome o ubiquinol oxidase subunit 2
MSNKAWRKWLFIGVPVATIIGLFVWYLLTHTVDVFAPMGEISQKERGLIFFASILSVIVVVPTFALTIFICLKYREGNKKPKKYSPDWDHSRLFESIWWGVPGAIILVLSVVAWQSAHHLDPYKTIASHSDQKPLKIQVVSLDWKWLFIYPKQHIASVNHFEIPVNRPVHFYVTSDAPMNSFWVPQLGGQIMAMPGMKTQIYEMATKTGTMHGSSANISGKGFADMRFSIKAESQNDFLLWANKLQQSPHVLTAAAYHHLAQPSTVKSKKVYGLVEKNLFHSIIMSYMKPKATPLPLQMDMTNMPEERP